MVQLKGSVLDSVWTSTLEIKLLKKIKEHISQNVVIITNSVRNND